MNASPSDASEVLDFWFLREGEEGYGEFRDAWFEKDPDFDREVRDRFEGLYKAAASGELDFWRDEPHSALALVIALDQFPRNMFRGDPKTYATDDKALRVAKEAVERAFDREVPEFQRSFFYMPFMHSESVEDQQKCVALFEALGSENLEYATGHRDIVERFGRFPHRNAVLGRETTPEEAEFLKGPDSSF